MSMDPAVLVLSFQAWLLLKPQFLYLYHGVEWDGGGVSMIYKKGAQSWAYSRTSGSASPLPFPCLSPSRYEMSVWDVLGFLLVS